MPSPAFNRRYFRSGHSLARAFISPIGTAAARFAGTEPAQATRSRGSRPAAPTRPERRAAIGAARGIDRDGGLGQRRDALGIRRVSGVAGQCSDRESRCGSGSSSA